MHPDKCSFRASSALFLRAVGLCFAFAFASLWAQAAGLYGPEGVTPVHVAVIANTSSLFGARTWAQLLERFPKTLLAVLSGATGVSPFQALSLTCCAGTVLGVLVTLGLTTPPAFFGLWAMYAGIFSNGGQFMTFQWDILLLEVGFAAALLAPWKPQWSYPAAGQGTEPRKGPLLLLRLILFKLMFMSGVVKITSRCASWSKLTACHYHFATQPLPTLPAYYLHNLPGVWLGASVMATLAIELPLTALILVPQRHCRIVAAWLNSTLMLVIALSGNYNFFNLLTAVLTLPLLDDAHVAFLGLAAPRAAPAPRERPPASALARAVAGWRVVDDQVVVWGVVLFFAIVAAFLGPFEFGGPAGFRVAFGVDALEAFLRVALPVLLVAAGLVLLAAGAYDVANAVRTPSAGRGSAGRAVWPAVCAGLVLLLHVGGAPGGLLSLDRSNMQLQLRRRPWLKSAHEVVAGRLHAAAGYGLFRHMTGVGPKDMKKEGKQVERPELVLEVSEDDLNWYEVEFKYKPGDVTAAPAWVAPHQPRLDWQMWFAALAGKRAIATHRWLLGLMRGIVAGSPPVLRLLSQSTQPQGSPLLAPLSGGPPPRRVRLARYAYDFHQPEWGRQRTWDVYCECSVFKTETPVNATVAYWRRRRTEELAGPFAREQLETAWGAGQAPQGCAAVGWLRRVPCGVLAGAAEAAAGLETVGPWAAGVAAVGGLVWQRRQRRHAAAQGDGESGKNRAKTE
ncbi:unnamed protein product [Pedinophyceae sp. YPF-701]|nr:unnamed protein product [Pedinophyceae sp. YPF-701]